MKQQSLYGFFLNFKLASPITHLFPVLLISVAYKKQLSLKYNIFSRQKSRGYDYK